MNYEKLKKANDLSRDIESLKQKRLSQVEDIKRAICLMDHGMVGCYSTDTLQAVDNIERELRADIEKLDVKLDALINKLEKEFKAL